MTASRLVRLGRLAGPEPLLGRVSERLPTWFDRALVHVDAGGRAVSGAPPGPVSAAGPGDRPV